MADVGVGVEIGNISTGNPTVTVSATPSGGIVPVEIGNLSTGNPTVSVSVTTVLDPGLTVQIGSLSTGNPTISVSATPEEVQQGQAVSIPIDNNGDINWTGSLRIIDKLVPPGEERYLRTVETVGSGNLRIRFSSSPTEDPASEGDDLTSAWETYEAAITIVDSDDVEIVLKGPGNADNAFTDPTEVYFWTPDNFAALAAYLTSHLDETVTFVFDDGVIPISPVSVEIGNLSAGNPTASVSATVINTNVAADIGILSTGAPTLSVSVAVRNANVEADIGNISTGDPTVSVSASVITANVPAEIGNLSTGSPSVTVEVIPISIDFDAVEVEIGDICQQAIRL